MKNDFIPFCIEFAKKYKNISEGLYLSDDGRHAIEKTEINGADFSRMSIPLRVNIDMGTVQINTNLDNYSESAIIFMLVWCFLRYKNQYKDKMRISDIVIDEMTMEALLKEPGFSPKEAMLSLLDNTKDSASSEYINRLENLVK